MEERVKWNFQQVCMTPKSQTSRIILKIIMTMLLGGGWGCLGEGIGWVGKEYNNS
jgi:hypothetical protein